jgi:type II secretory ATPase GspE/PulE/Tfp pilus assembly ATPase PilB-like protein
VRFSAALSFAQFGTTLYSALHYLRSPKVNITTIEDPVEYVIDGVNQVQVNAKAGRTFASCLRSMLRQDPNVVMVGEIRDGETAEIALTAAQTGHLVLSTLHTNDAISAITRLADLDVLDFLIASSVTAIIAQRLVRKLCSCRGEIPVTKEYLFKMRGAGLEYKGEKTFVPVGCNICDRSGYKGRIGVYELLVIDEQMRAAIRDERDSQLRTIARMGGFQSMREDALQKVTSGLTTLDEIRRVVPLEHTEELLCEQCHQFLVANFNYCPRCGIKVPEPQPGPQTVMMPSSM